MNRDLAEMALQDNIADENEAAPETVPVPRSLVPRLSQTAILLDIDGTLLDLMPTPREVWVPPGLAETLKRLVERTGGALALVSGRSLNDIDLIFAPDVFPAVGGHGAEMRIDPDNESVAAHAPPMDKELKRRLAAIAKLSQEQRDVVHLFYGEDLSVDDVASVLGVPAGTVKSRLHHAREFLKNHSGE